MTQEPIIDKLERAEREGPRLFILERDEDVSGVSGTGVVAEGIEFSDGVVALRWTSDWPTSVVFHDRGIESVQAVHGHSGKTRIVYLSGMVSDDIYMGTFRGLQAEMRKSDSLLSQLREAQERAERAEAELVIANRVVERHLPSAVESVGRDAALAASEQALREAQGALERGWSWGQYQYATEHGIAALAPNTEGTES